MNADPENTKKQVNNQQHQDENWNSKVQYLTKQWRKKIDSKNHHL